MFLIVIFESYGYQKATVVEVRNLGEEAIFKGYRGLLLEILIGISDSRLPFWLFMPKTDINSFA